MMQKNSMQTLTRGAGTGREGKRNRPPNSCEPCRSQKYVPDPSLDSLMLTGIGRNAIVAYLVTPASSGASSRRVIMRTTQIERG